jgi:hypothetical protein
MNNFTVVDGDTIRGYDFKPMVGRDDSFVEGVVLDSLDRSQGYAAYRIRVTRDHFSNADDNTAPGADTRVGHEIFVPHRVSFNEYSGRIINLSR